MLLRFHDIVFCSTTTAGFRAWEWAKGNDLVRQCPNCPKYIEKNGGCNSMYVTWAVTVSTAVSGVCVFVWTCRYCTACKLSFSWPAARPVVPLPALDLIKSASALETTTLVYTDGVYTPVVRSASVVIMVPFSESTLDGESKRERRGDEPKVPLLGIGSHTVDDASMMDVEVGFTMLPLTAKSVGWRRFSERITQRLATLWG